MPSVVGYYEQEVLVDRLFAFLHVLWIFFGLFVDFRASGTATPPGLVLWRATPGVA